MNISQLATCTGVCAWYLTYVIPKVLLSLFYRQRSGSVETPNLASGDTEIEIQSKEQEHKAISFNGFLMLGGLFVLALILFLSQPLLILTVTGQLTALTTFDTIS